MKRLVAMVACLSLTLGACSNDGPRDTPEATITSLKAAVKEGRANKIGDFLYADNPDMRKLMNRTGIMLGNVQKLGAAVQVRFPDEVAALKIKAEEAAKEGKATGLLAQMSASMNRNQRRNRQVTIKVGDPKPADRAGIDTAIQGLFADPYGWIDQADTRMTTVFLTDNSVAVLWDAKPVMPPIGMTMMKGDDDRWYFVLPTNLPGISGFMPKTPEQYQIFGSLIVTIDKTVIDLTKDIEDGRVRSLNELSEKAGEKALIPAAMAFFAYANYTENLRKETKEKKQNGG